jgi:hypothetical protein
LMEDFSPIRWPAGSAARGTKDRAEMPCPEG